MTPTRDLIPRLRVRHLATGLLLAALAACGGGGGGGDGASGAPGSLTPPAAPSGPVAASAATSGAPIGEVLVSLRSASGDWVGGGAAHDYGLANAVFRLSTSGTRLTLNVDGAQSWTGEFVLPGNGSQLEPGSYGGLTRYPFQVAGAGALAWTGQGRGCNTLLGSVLIRSITYQAGVLQSLDMSFEQYCEGSSAALRGEVRISAAAMAQITHPQNPQLEQAVVALQSDAGEYIGGGATQGYDHTNAVITVTGSGKLFSVRVAGDQHWSGDFLWPGAGAEIAPGTTTGLTRYPFMAAGAGGMNWEGEGRGCNTLSATVVVHGVRYEAGLLRAIDFDFEQHCWGTAPALRGRIRWDANLVTTPPGPVMPVPDNLWAPPPGALPASGNAMYLTSAPGDPVGQGWTWWVNAPPSSSTEAQGTATVSITESAGLLSVTLAGSVSWSGQFKAPQHLGRLEPGYYGIVRRYPFHNPARGGLSWTMDGRGCNTLSGWFAVDSIRYDDAGRLLALDLRFAQYCDGAVTPLLGRIRWSLTNGPGT